MFHPPLRPPPCPRFRASTFPSLLHLSLILTLPLPLPLYPYPYPYPYPYLQPQPQPGAGTALAYSPLLACAAARSDPSWRASAIGTVRFWRDLGYAVGGVLLAQAVVSK